VGVSGFVMEYIDMGRDLDSSRAEVGGNGDVELAGTDQISVGSRIPTSNISMLRLPNLSSANVDRNMEEDLLWLLWHPYQHP
jgi:hypothetical protein